MKKDRIDSKLQDILEQAAEFNLTPKDKFVIFSDLHIGDGSIYDEHLRNSALFYQVLKHYYLKHNYHLILNGDIEDLQKFVLSDIQKHWSRLYSIFRQFSKTTTLIKITGNHDFTLNQIKNYSLFPFLGQAVRLNYEGNRILIFHGHQASNLFDDYHHTLGFIFRYIAKPIGVKNLSTRYNSRRKFTVERRVYEFSNANRIVSIIGHTHRPLFESLSKVDSLKFQIERLCRDHGPAKLDEKQQIEKQIAILNHHLKLCIEKNRRESSTSSLYNSGLPIPSVFNSGCTVGKRGITALEIRNNSIYLVHWFDERKAMKYLSHNNHEPERLDQSPYFKIILNEDRLDYIFSKIQLLT